MGARFPIQGTDQRSKWKLLCQMSALRAKSTSDEHLSAVQYLSGAGLSGAVVVTTPQETALLDVRKELQFCRKLGARVLGVVENMSLFVCPNCKVGLLYKRWQTSMRVTRWEASTAAHGHLLTRVLQTRSEIFPATTGGAAQMCLDLDVPLLGKLPLDPILARCCDDGRDFLQELPQSPAVIQLTQIIGSECGIELR
ncbi:hypothetical protein MSG28_005396 [Choristoneura fumiferana]|uniref:Uncharacterized protein n=1 Tax=Choristoneura fumiferana TaxID=7141 RepID=A0ACC0JRH9_CHOFU|nr:hypothetical protein MSG28_005396 [Choristoneura fumiferana]